MYLVANQTDTIMIGIIIGTEQAGVYNVASRIAGLTAFVLLAINTFLAPLISELYTKQENSELQTLVRAGARIAAVVSLLVVIGLIVLGKVLLGLFGEGFANGYSPLVILAVSQFINALAGSVGLIMIMTGYEAQATKIITGSAVLNIVLNLALIPMFGIVGAAIATTITTILWNFLMFRFVLRSLRINTSAIPLRSL